MAAIAYLLWGVLPIYWHELHPVAPQEIMIHRMIWSFVVAVALLALRKRWQWLRDGLRHPASLRVFVLTGGLLSINWLVYLWANNNGHIVEASLGYFITPLVNVVLGLLVLHERLRPGQWLAIAIASSAVLYLSLNVGRWVWIALILAFSFGFYGLLRKMARLGSLEGFTTEMAVLLAPALAYWLYLASRGQSAFFTDGAGTAALLIFSGVVTAVPLILFAAGARQVPLTTLGVLQYIAPTLQFSIGVFLYHEPFDRARLLGFCVVWLALIIYWFEGYWQRRKKLQARLALPINRN